MSELTSKATVELQINGQQAQDRLAQLRQNAMQLETALAKAAAAGNKVDLKKLRKELTDTKRQIREMESSTMQVEQVLRSLDRATPKELSKTLSTLTRQLEYIERGSSAWDVQMEKIKKVKAEIASINVQMREQESFATRLNRTFNDWSTSIMGAAAAMTGLVMAGRSAVSAYADMDEELTNTQKYTGMTRSKVEELNESFKHLNTRTSRSELNELAQEAGRLGKTSIEDVQGYVEAADIINVALVDLGEGATQTIAKLSNIFGIEKMMGTKDAMLAVGSTVNVLSQNCTASKPYLVEFAQRMAGIGAQAKMTIPEIIAFGAVLDSNGQKSEMASSALGKLTMMLFQDPAKMAKQVGLAVDSFTETMKRSTTEGVIMFLEKIQQLGSKDGLSVLAPLFKDLGMDGVRMSQVLSTLAAHLDEVKWQIGEANKAFTEATSATGEYQLFNNTVQAGLDKAKKHMSELAIELGEKLLPVMRHVYSSSSLMLRLLNTMVDFVLKYGKDIVELTAIIAAYNIGIRASAIYTKSAAVATTAWNTVVRLATTITTGYTAAMSLCKDAVVGCSLANQRLYRLMLSQNVVTKLLTATTLLLRAAYYACTLQFGAMQASLKSLYVVMAANPYGIVLATVTALGVAIYKNIEAKKERIRIHDEEMRKEREAMKEYYDEYAHVKMLTSIVNDNNKSLEDRRAAIAELKKICPGYNAQLSDEGTLVNNNTQALDDYLAKLKEVVRMKANREKLENLYKKQQELEETEQTQSDNYWKIRQQNTLQGFNRNSLTGRVVQAWGRLTNNTNTEGGAAEQLADTREELRNVNNQIKALEPKIKPEPVEPSEKVKAVETAETNIPEGESGSSSSSGSNGSKIKEDKFAYEKAWKEREEALTRIQYAQGKIDYEKYTTDMLSIDTQYYAEMLSHSDLSADERTSLEAKYFEAEKKQKDEESKLSIQEENNRYNEELSILKQRYIDGESTTATYENAAELAELAHLRRMVSITTEGSDERLAAEKAYQDKLFANQKKRQQEAEKLAKEHQEKLKEIKKNVFGMSPSERQAAYEADLELLKEVFDKEIKAAENNAKEKLRIEKAFYRAKLALAKQYNVSVSKEGMNAMEKWNDDIMDFLDSDTGKAITGGFETMVSGMSSLFSGLTSIVESELEIQTAAIESRYEKELSLCEGNTYMEKKLEKQKEADIAKAKNEANKKAFAMQVIQAVAQTAVSAINAYSSAAAVPLIGYILAPIAAATAVAAGMVQIAALKKQQQASEAQGYSSGGYTKKGAKYEEAGIVHAGEWVASQELLSNPVASQMIQTLDYAQRTNTIGSLTSDDVSQSITAPAVLARNSNTALATPKQVIVKNASELGSGNGGNGNGGNGSGNSGLSDETVSEYAQVMKSLKDRLDQPFITVNSITGDTGIEQAQSEYDRLIRNKTPKSRR